MNKKLYWGLGVLFILIIGGFVFLLVQQNAEPQSVGSRRSQR